MIGWLLCLIGLHEWWAVEPRRKFDIRNSTTLGGVVGEDVCGRCPAKRIRWQRGKTVTRK